MAGLYKRRWKIELFFRWLKCVFSRPEQWHWMAESKEGVAVQIYSGMIAALLLALYTGTLPNKRLMEMFQLHDLGLVSDEELQRAIEASKREKPKKAKKR